MDQQPYAPPSARVADVVEARSRPRVVVWSSRLLGLAIAIDLVALGMAKVLRDIVELASFRAMPEVVTVVAAITIAAVLLLTPSANAWFRARRAKTADLRN